MFALKWIESNVILFSTLMRQTARLAGVGLAVVYFCSAIRADTVQGGIIAFRADVIVKQNATLEVREEITLDNAEKYYRYGFIRNLPIDSDDRWDPKYVGAYQRDNGIRVTILEVTQDGRPIRYEQGQGYGYSQLRIGAKNVPLDAAEHRYVIRYSVTGALKPGASADTLYWNAIGHERDVPVEEAILSVHLPAGVSASDATVEPRVAGRGPWRKLSASRGDGIGAGRRWRGNRDISGHARCAETKFESSRDLARRVCPCLQVLIGKRRSVAPGHSRPAISLLSGGLVSHWPRAQAGYGSNQL